MGKKQISVTLTLSENDILTKHYDSHYFLLNAQIS